MHAAHTHTHAAHNTTHICGAQAPAAERVSLPALGLGLCRGDVGLLSSSSGRVQPSPSLLFAGLVAAWCVGGVWFVCINQRAGSTIVRAVCGVGVCVRVCFVSPCWLHCVVWAGISRGCLSLLPPPTRGAFCHEGFGHLLIAPNRLYAVLYIALANEKGAPLPPLID